MLDRIITWFLPMEVRNNKTHPQYYELRTVIVPLLFGVVVVPLFPTFFAAFHMGKHLYMYYVNAGLHLVTLFSIRAFGRYRLSNVIAASTTYYLIYTWLEDTGMVYSTNMCLIHMFLLGGILADRKWGWLIIISNLLFLILIYKASANTATSIILSNTLGSPLYALITHSLITLFLGSFLATTLRNNELSRRKIARLQEQRISLLDEAVRKRTEQLNSMRQTIATDFHDQTGNMLAAINRQASILEIKLSEQKELIPLVKSIITNSTDLHASGKDFLWTLNHDSDNPFTLFEYLTGYGQNFYNQFDIAFSTEVKGFQNIAQQLSPFAALNLIYIFKEAMNNVIKHSGADEVVMTMIYASGKVTYSLTDNGRWLETDMSTTHYGLNNIKRRSEQCGFNHQVAGTENGTTVTIMVSLSTYYINNEEK